jgi:hypothetical protein
MKRIFKFSIASLLAMCLAVATVVCCCIAPAVTAHFHKVAMCSHCPDQSSQGNSSNPAGVCRNQLTSAEFLHGQTISTPNVSAQSFPAPVFLNHHTVLSPALSLAYPPGSPPLGISFIPLYLRTFNLRV